jgi:hypothetical protein
MVSSNYTQLDIHLLISGIAVTLFVKSVGTMLRKKRATGQLNLVLAITSPLLFVFATLVRLMLRGR